MTQDEKNKITLKEFIKDNYQLLTIIGVFGALFSLFSGTDFIIRHQLGLYLIIVTLFIFVLTSFEILKYFPRLKKQASSFLYLFKILFIYFNFLVLSFTYFNLKEVWKGWKQLFLTFIFIVLGFIIFPLIDKKIEQKYIRILSYFIFLITIIFLGFLLLKYIFKVPLYKEFF